MRQNHLKSQALLNHARLGTETHIEHLSHCDECQGHLDFMAMGALVARADDPLHRNHSAYISESMIIDWLFGDLNSEEATMVSALVEGCVQCAALAQGVQNDLAQLAEAECLEQEAGLSLPWILRLSMDGVTLREFSPRHQTLTIGSDPSSTIQLMGTGIAPIHAIIHFDDDESPRLTVPAQAKVLLDGEPIPFGALLEGYQTLGLGAYELRLENKIRPLSETERRIAQAGQAALTHIDLKRLRAQWRKASLKEAQAKGRVLEIREYWGDITLDIRQFKGKTPRIRLSDQSQGQNAFFVPRERLLREDFPFLEQMNGRWHLYFKPYFQGFISHDNALYALEDLIDEGIAQFDPIGEIYRVELAQEDGFLVAIGQEVFSGAFVVPQKKMIQNFAIDRAFASLFAVILAMTTMTFAAIQSVPDRKTPTYIERIPPSVVKLLRPGKKAEKAETVRVKDEDAQPTPNASSQSQKKKKAGAAPSVNQRRDPGLSAESTEKMAFLNVLKSRNPSRMKKGLPALLDSKGSEMDIFITESGNTIDMPAGLKGQVTALHHLPQNIEGPAIANKELVVAGREKVVPTATIETPQQTIGGLDRDLIKETLNAYRAQVNSCHTRALNLAPEITGRVVLQFTVENTGTVLDVRVMDDTTATKSLARCLKTRAKSWRFPAFKGDIAAFDVPMVF